VRQCVEGLDCDSTAHGPTGHDQGVRWRRRSTRVGRRAGGEPQPLRLDPDAVSASDDLPAFLARPTDKPVYYGFPIIDGSEIDGFRLGMITDFVAAPQGFGDGFVVAPDDSRAGLVWESEAIEPYFEEVIAPDAGRWGVWGVGSRLQLAHERDARPFLESLLPELRPRWDAWRAHPDDGQRPVEWWSSR
jgi:hypothetical protein